MSILSTRWCTDKNHMLTARQSTNKPLLTAKEEVLKGRK